MSGTSTHFKGSLLAVAGVLVGIAVILLLISSANGSSDDQTRKADANDLTTAVKVAPIESVSDQQNAAFSVLGTGSATMPASTRKILENPSVDIDRYGLNLNLAAGIGSPASDDPIWIIPGKDAVCLYITDPVDGGGTTCASTEDAIAGKLTIALRPGPGKAGKVAMAGLVADGTDSAVLSSDKGSDSTELSIKDNLWGFKADSPDTVTIDGPNGKYTVTAP